MSDNPVTRESPDQSKADEAKEQGKHVADHARQEVGSVAEKVRDEAGSVAVVAQDQVRGLLSDAQDRVQQEAQQQVDRLAGALQGFGKNLQALREGRTEEAGPLAGYLERAQDEIERFGSRVEDLGLSGILDETRRFARRRPGVFLGSAALAGLVAGRLTRSGRDAQRAEHDSGAGSRGSSPADTGQRQIATTPSPARTSGVGGPAGRGAGTAPTPGTGSTGSVPTPGTGASGTVSTPATGAPTTGRSGVSAEPVDEHGTVRGVGESDR